MKVLLAESRGYFDLGGAAKACRGLMEGLAQRGHSCAVVSIENRQKQAAQGFRLAGTAGVAELERHGVKIFAAESAQEQWRPMVKCLRTFEPDWILICERGVMLHTMAAEHQRGSRVVRMVLGMIIDLPTQSSAALEAQFRKLLQKTAGIITISNYIRDSVKRWSGRDSTVLHFPAHGTGPFPHFNNFDSGYVTMVNPSVSKGMSILVSLARALPQVQFAAVPLWGTTPEDRVALTQLPNMTLLQASPNLDDIFKQTKVLLAPSLWGEGYGLVVVDAMLRGIPVLASNAGGLPEAKLGVDYVLPVNMIERYELDTQNQIQPVVPEQDATPWIETLNRVLTDRALYDRLSAESRDAALSYVSDLGPVPFERYLEGLAAAGERSRVSSG